MFAGTTSFLLSNGLEYEAMVLETIHWLDERYQTGTMNFAEIEVWLRAHPASLSRPSRPNVDLNPLLFGKSRLLNRDSAWVPVLVLRPVQSQTAHWGVARAANGNRL